MTTPVFLRRSNMSVYALAASARGLALCLATASPALAQQTSDESWTRDVVVVTGQKDSQSAPDAGTTTRTPTPVEEIPQSVQVLTRTLIEEQDLRTISDALVNVSGVAPSKTYEIVLQSPVIRGFRTDYLIDGLPAYGLPSGTVDPGSLVNVERVEVAKGPTATLYGGGAGSPLSGLINLVSKDPTSSFSGYVSARAGSFGTVGVDGDINAPLGDAVQFRMTGAWEQSDSYLDVIDMDKYSLYPTIAFNLSDATRLTLRGQYSRIEQQEYSGLPYELIDDPTVDPFTFAGAEDAPPTVIENALLTADLRHSFSDNLQGQLTIRRYESAFDEFSTFPFPVVPAAGTTYGFFKAGLPTDVEQTFATASLYATFDAIGASHGLLVGVDVDDTDYVAEIAFEPLAFIDYADPSTNAAYGAPVTLTDRQTDSMSTLALFVQDQLSIGDRLDLTAGLRWTRLNVHNTYTSFGLSFLDTDREYWRVTPRIGATYEIADGLSAFAGYSEGFAGLVAPLGLVNPQPETSQSYEAGFKFFGVIPGLSGTAALYQITRQNVKTADPVIPFASIQTGEQRARGIELDLVYEPTANLSLLANYAYTDAEVTKDNTLPVGDRPARVPEHSGRLAARYRFREGPLGPLEVGAGATFVSDRDLTLPNTSTVDGSVLIDAQATWDFEFATLGLSIVNLTDELSFEPYQYLAGAIVIPTQPRSVFLSLRRAF